MINILFFASYRQALGFGSLELKPDKLEQVGDLMILLKASYGDKAGFLDEPNLLVAVNQEIAGTRTPIKEGDEVAFFPPVTGG